jgi:hypothetical protein
MDGSHQDRATSAHQQPIKVRPREAETQSRAGRSSHQGRSSARPPLNRTASPLTTGSGTPLTPSSSRHKLPITPITENPPSTSNFIPGSGLKHPSTLTMTTGHT